MNEKLIMALRTTTMGMGIVILTLYVLSLILNFMKCIFHPEDNKNGKKAKTSLKLPKQSLKTDYKDKSEEEVESVDDEQIVAVICAALTSYLERPISSVHIGAIRKIHTNTPIWGMASRLKGKL